MSRYLLSALVLFSFFLAPASFAEKTSTRFGEISVLSRFEMDNFDDADSDKQRSVHLNDVVVEPLITPRNNFIVEQVFEFNNKDVVLLMDLGGTGCPAMYRLLTLSDAGVSATDEFGTCSDLPEISVEGEVMTITLPDSAPLYAQREMSEKELDKLFSTSYIYTFSDGKLSEKIVTATPKK